MSQPYQSHNTDYILHLARRVVSAITVTEFATVISEANLNFNKREWDCFMAECRRLKAESKQKEHAP